MDRKKWRDQPTELFQGEDGVVHLVIEKRETLCCLVINSMVAPLSHGIVWGETITTNVPVTCMGCLAEENT